MEQNQTLLKKYWPHITIAILLFCWFHSCQNQNTKISDLEAQMSIDSLNFETTKEKVAIQEKVIVSDKKLMKELTEEVKGLKDINAQIKATVHTKIVRVRAEPVTTIKTVHDTIRDSSGVRINHMLKLPQSYAYDDEWFKIQYNIDTSGISVIDTAQFINKPVVSFGYKDEGFIKNMFKSDIPVVSYQDKNPYSNVKGLQNIEFKPKKRWYNRKIVTLGVGFVGGIYIATKL